MTILCWSKNPEDEAIKQAENIERHPCLVGNVCLMADTHSGYGMPIGGVVAFDNAVCPNMVGVDIGCGMLAVQTSLTDISKDDLLKIHKGITENIPVGFSHHQNVQENELFNDSRWEETIICKQEKESAKHQIGTLGGGNHFIEIQKGNDEHIWFMIHSGSRNLGKKVADYYNKIAEKLCNLWKQEETVKNELAFLPKGTQEFEDYWREMNLCLDFAYQNRQMMSNVIKQEFLKVISDCEFMQEINIHHNYASFEHHYSRNVIVHRKGATLARENTIGIIPGSQGTSSYIIQGLGNEKSLCSCSHGAGRKMSRKKAKENLSVEHEQEIMGNIIHNITTKEQLDEAPSAYKDIDTVMEEQKDLVKILVQLKPLAVVKG